MIVDKLASQVAKARFELDSATRTFEREKVEAVRVSARLAAVKEAQVLTQMVAKDVQGRAYACIASIVTRCLEAVFDEPYEFCLEFVTRRGKTEADLWFERDGERLDPMSDSGGGVVDVAAFALRLSALLLQGDSSRRMLILDEPFKFLSEEYRGRIGELMLCLSEELDLQILMVTHIKELEIGKVVQLG